MTSLVSRNIMLSALAIILLVLVIIVRGRSPFGRGQSTFASSPKNEITRIELSDGDKKLVLTKDAEKWMINGKYEARKSGIVSFSNLLTGIKIKSPVSADLFEKEIISRGIRPVKVRVSERSRLLREFYVYRTASNKYGNIMKLKERSKPFMVFLPGFEGDIGSDFVVNEDYWKPYTIFNLLPSEISSITLENNSDPASSFTILHSYGRYKLLDSKNELTGWDSTRIKRYISYFTRVSFEKWALEMTDTEKKRLESISPDFVLRVNTSEGKEIILSLWRRRIDGSESEDSDRMWGKTDAGDEYFVVRFFDIDPVLKKRSYFFGQ